MIHLRSTRHVAATFALVAVDIITSAAITMSETVVVVGSTVTGLIEGWARS